MIIEPLLIKTEMNKEKLLEGSIPGSLVINVEKHGYSIFGLSAYVMQSKITKMRTKISHTDQGEKYLNAFFEKHELERVKDVCNQYELAFHEFDDYLVVEYPNEWANGYQLYMDELLVQEVVKSKPYLLEIERMIKNFDSEKSTPLEALNLLVLLKSKIVISDKIIRLSDN